MTRAVLPGEWRDLPGCIAHLHRCPISPGLLNPAPAGVGAAEGTMVLLAPQLGVATHGGSRRARRSSCGSGAPCSRSRRASSRSLSGGRAGDAGRSAVARQPDPVARDERRQLLRERRSLRAAAASREIEPVHAASRAAPPSRARSSATSVSTVSPRVAASASSGVRRQTSRSGAAPLRRPIAPRAAAHLDDVVLVRHVALELAHHLGDDRRAASPRSARAGSPAPNGSPSPDSRRRGSSAGSSPARASSRRSRCRRRSSCPA